MPRTRSVQLEYVDHEVGLWCNTCMMSTGIAFWITLDDGTDVTVMDATFRTEPGGDDHDVEG
jgi:hypothetical protein